MSSFLVLLDCISPKGCRDVSTSHALPESCRSVSCLLVLTGPLCLDNQDVAEVAHPAFPGQVRTGGPVSWTIYSWNPITWFQQAQEERSQQQASSKCQTRNVNGRIEYLMGGAPWQPSCFHWEHREPQPTTSLVCAQFGDTAIFQKGKELFKKNENSDRI